MTKRLSVALGLVSVLWISSVTALTCDAVARYRFTDGSGTTVTNSGTGGSALNGTTINTPSWSCTRNGNPCMTFTATSNQRVELPNEAALTITSNITLTAWIMTTSNTVHIIGGYQNAPSYPGYGLAIGPAGANLLGYWNGGGWVAGNSAVNTGAWLHVAVSVAGTVASFYRNGVADGTPTSSAPSSFAGTRNLAATAGVGSQFFDGSIDDLQIFPCALSADDIGVVMNEGAVSAVHRRPLALD